MFQPIKPQIDALIKINFAASGLTKTDFIKELLL